jgi:hypothetical protein
VSTVRRMALTTFHGRRQQKTEPSTRFRSDEELERGGRVDRRRVAITKLDAPRLVAGGSDHASYNCVAGGVSKRFEGRTYRLQGSAARAWGDAAFSR